MILLNLNNIYQESDIMQIENAVDNNEIVTNIKRDKVDKKVP
jgi:hypothetical protein